MRGSECDSGFTSNLIFYILECLFKVCLQIPFGKSLCCVETCKLICNANELAGFYMVQVFVVGISEQTIVQLYSRKQPSQSALLFLYFLRFRSLWFCRLLSCSYT